MRLEKKINKLLLVLVSMLLSTLGQAQQNDVERELMHLEREEAAVWTAKPNTASIATIDRVLADDFVCICEGIEVTKAQAVADFKSGDSKVEFIKSGEMKIRVFGEVAVVTGSDNRKGSYKGIDYSGHYVWTDVLVKRRGRWQQVVAHFSQVLE